MSDSEISNAVLKVLEDEQMQKLISDLSNFDDGSDNNANNDFGDW